MMKAGEFLDTASLYSNKCLTAFNTSSLNASADSTGKPKRVQSPSAYAAAMEEFKNGSYCGDSGDILDT
jgi:hypothetical protein